MQTNVASLQLSIWCDYAVIIFFFFFLYFSILFHFFFSSIVSMCFFFHCFVRCRFSFLSFSILHSFVNIFPHSPITTTTATTIGLMRGFLIFFFFAIFPIFLLPVMLLLWCGCKTVCLYSFHSLSFNHWNGFRSILSENAYGTLVWCRKSNKTKVCSIYVFRKLNYVKKKIVCDNAISKSI